MADIEEIFGIKTDNKELFESAVTHPSYTQEKGLDYTKCYERLEFLGDAVLIVFFQKSPKKSGLLI